MLLVIVVADTIGPGAVGTISGVYTGVKPLVVLILVATTGPGCVGTIIGRIVPPVVFVLALAVTTIVT